MQLISYSSNKPSLSEATFTVRHDCVVPFSMYIIRTNQNIHSVMLNVERYQSGADIGI